MLSRGWIWVCLLCCCFCATSYAQNLTLTTQNRYVIATVEAGSGCIGLTLPPGGPAAARLSYYPKSYVTVNVNGRMFTNNNVGINIQNQPQFAGYLSNGVNRKVGDTIITTWLNREGCDIIQEVYPVLLDTSGQIIMRWKVRNNNTQPLFAQVQYLLDLQVGYDANDDSPVLTRYGYDPIWEQFTAGSQPFGIPWYFAAFENRPSDNPGVIGAGYTHDVNYKLGLIKPAVMSIGDWKQPYGHALVDFLWGPPPDAPWGQNYGDAAILYQWDAVGILGKKTAEIGRTSYGTPEFSFCYGDLFGILFNPKHFKWKGSKYDPDTATVEFYAFNTNSPQPGAADFGPAANNTRLKLHVGPSLRIVDPAPDASSNGKIQTQLVGPQAGFIPQRGVGTAFWKIVADKARNCNEAIDSWLKFTCESSISESVFRNSGIADTCEHPINVDCADEDREPPIVAFESKTDSYPFIDTFTVRDDRSTDRGIDKLTWVATPGSNTDISKFSIVVTPDRKPCYRKPYTVVIAQLDSTIGGCFDFTFVDCAGNDTTHTVCLVPHPVPIIPDTLPPIVSTILTTPGYPGAMPCNGRCDSLLLTDNRLHDKGLKRVDVLAATNMKLRPTAITEGDVAVKTSVCVTDTMFDGMITLRIWDAADNYTDTTYRYCTIADTLAPLVTVTDDLLDRGHWTVVTEENRDWDRRIDIVDVYAQNNVTVTFPPYPATDLSFYAIEVSVIDSTKNASFCVRAHDLAGNWSAAKCTNLYPDPDIFPPNIRSTPPFGPNVSKVTVSIDDYHVNQAGDTLGWDKGIDSIWFSVPRGIIAPPPMKLACPMVAPTFTLTVEDTLNVDSITCITIYALDCAGNRHDTSWCYPYAPDDLPPFLRARYTSKTSIEFFVTDSGRLDRGIHQITLKDEDNFSPLVIDAERNAIWGPGTLIRTYGKSSVGILEAVDYWGALAFSPLVKDLHTASVDLSVWQQDVEMKKGIIVTDDGLFTLPINFVTNDTFALSRKGIDAFEFTLVLTGTTGALQFAGVRTTGTAADGWTVNPSVNGDRITITGTKPAGGSSLADQSLPLVILEWIPVRSEPTAEIVISTEPTKGETILYNNGADRLIVGKSALATLPATYGTLSGTHIIIPGTCSPIVQTTGNAPTIVSLTQNAPNPFSGQTSFSFALKADGRVRLAIFDMMGKEVGSVISAVLPSGTYKAGFDGSSLGSGSYIARLEANGVVRSRLIRIEH